MTQLDTTLVAKLRHLADLQADIAKLTAEAEAIKTDLRSLDAGDYEVDGRPALRITPTRKFDAVAAAAALPEDVRNQCLAVAYDGAKVKQHLTPAQLETFMVESGKPKVAIL